MFTRIAWESFTNRDVRFYYFYTQDESIPRASHYYPNDYPTENEVWIYIKADQQPVDEFFCVIFEMLNSEGEKRFQELMSQARAGTILRTNYALEITRQEFVATKRTHDLIGRLKFTRKEISSSQYYKRFLECPDGFEDFLVYQKKVVKGSQRDPIKEYETQYDLIRKRDPTTNSPP